MSVFSSVSLGGGFSKREGQRVEVRSPLKFANDHGVAVAQGNEDTWGKASRKVSLLALIASVGVGLHCVAKEETVSRIVRMSKLGRYEVVLAAFCYLPDSTTGSAIAPSKLERALRGDADLT